MEREVNSILVAAHELKAPLAILRQLAFSLDYADEDGRQKIQSEMINVSDRALRQVNDLTKIARLEDGLFEMEPVAVRRVCDEAVGELANYFLYNHRDLQVKYKNHSKLVVANPELLFSVIYNFCLNAAHYSEAETLSELMVSDRGDKVRVKVRDFGPTLPIEVAREMKRGWLKRPTSIAMRPGSSGLGLFIASKFSRYMNAEVGTIRHRDGTSFFVDLPVSYQARLF